MTFNTIEDRRKKFRVRYSGSFWFNTYLNALFVLIILMGSIAYSALQIDWNTRLFFLLPLGFLYSDAAMYLAHRYQQHNKKRHQSKAFEMHTHWHHGMFSEERMHVDSISDMNMVLLPFFVHGLVLGVVYLPLAIIADSVKLDIGWILLLSVALHSLWYECIHTMAHLRNPPLFISLANHHREHHNPKNMGRVNFGIATTLFDHVFRTRYSSK